MRSTSCGYPFAMVRSCNGVKLIYLVRHDPKNDRYIGHAMNCHWSKPDWSCLYKTARTVKYTEIVKDWRHSPSAKEIAKAAKRAAASYR